MSNSAKVDDAAMIGYVYLLRMGRYHKIGASADPRRRAEMFGALPEPSELIHTIQSRHPFAIEKALHRRFDDQRVRGEWFTLRREDVANICQVVHCDVVADLPEVLRSVAKTEVEAVTPPRTAWIAAPTPPRQSRSPAYTVSVRLSPEMEAAFKAYLDSLHPRPSVTSAIQMILEDFLTKQGFWPLQEECAVPRKKPRGRPRKQPTADSAADVPAEEASAEPTEE